MVHKPAMENFYIEQPDKWFVWLDLDDTLWDFTGNSLKALDEVYRHFDLGRFWSDSEAWKSHYHSVNFPLWDELAAGRVTPEELRYRRFYDTFTQGGMAHDEADRIALSADSFYLKVLGKQTEVVDGAFALLRRLRDRGFRMGVLSNGFADVQYDKLRGSGLDKFVELVVLSEDNPDGGRGKPHRSIYEHANKLSGVPASRSVMIGDNPDTDILGAVDAGWVLAIWFDDASRQAHRPDGSRFTCNHSEITTVLTVSSLDEITL